MKKIPYVLAGIILLVLILSPLFIKVEVTCKSQYGECPSDITSRLTPLNSKSLFQVRRESSAILKKEFTVYAFSSQFKLPNRLEIDLLIKKPSFAIKDLTSGKYGMIDDRGVVLSVGDSTLLPTIFANQEIKVGEKVPDNILFALQLIQGINEMYQIKTGQIEDASLHVELPGQITVLFPLEGDVKLLLGEIRIVYAKVLSPEIAGKYKEIDLRFKNPVLR